MDKHEILDQLKKENVEFIRLQFTDIKGRLKNITVTSKHLEDVIDMNYVFSAHGLYDTDNNRSDQLYLRPDLDSFAVLPWVDQHGRTARLLCDVLNSDNEELPLNPRYILKKIVGKASELGYTFYINSECEFFMFHLDDNGLPTTLTHDKASFLDSAPLDIGINAKRGIVLGLEEMGFDVASFHHETAPAQHEIVFSDTEALQAADQVISLRNAVGSIARRHGLHATFMPKPTAGVNGSGMHLTLSLYKDDRNIFNNNDDGQKLNKVTRNFIGGIIEHAYEMCPFTNPLVNSYKRIVSGLEAPQNVDWGSTSSNTLIKVKSRTGEDRKIEVCLPDSAADPYISIALCIASGLDGISREIEPPLEGINSANKLPESLGEALRFADNSAFIRATLGDEFTERYLNIKRAEWKSYMSQVSAWEHDNYLFTT